MPHNSYYKNRWDAIGIFASAACAIHCLLLPVFLTTLPFLGIEIIENKGVEITTILISLMVGVWALYNGFRKHHHYLWPLLVFIAGILCIIVANSIGKNREAEVILKSAGVACIIVAHGFNWKYCKSCARCNHAGNASIRHSGALVR